MRRVMGMVGVWMCAVTAQAASLDQAQMQYLQERYGEALATCEELLPQAVNSQERFELQRLHALSLMQLGQPARARAELEAMLTVTDADNEEVEAQLTVHYGDSWALEGKFDEARRQYQTVLERYPNTAAIASAMFGLGRLYQKQGFQEEATKTYTTLVDKFPLSFEGKMAQRVLADGVYLTVQVGSFQERGNAERLVASLRAKGRQAYLESVPRGSQTTYRVKVGKFTSRTEAEAEQTVLSQSGLPASITP